jgi:uncharacterized protein (TIGR03067 family)
MVRALLAALVCAVPVLAEPREEAALRQTLESLQGDWSVQKMTIAGNQSDPAALRGLGFSFDGDRIVKSGQPEESARLNIDVSGRIPKVEFTDRNGITRGGVIMRSGDRVYLCVAEAGDRPPPTSFESTADNGAVLIEMTRARR